MKTLESILEKSVIQILLLALMVMVTYGHTLDVPFYLDDFSSIQENPVIYNWQGSLAELWQFSALRIVGYLSFAWNYQWTQFQVESYHLVNIIIHFLTGCAVLALLSRLMSTPRAQATVPQWAQQWLPLVVALIFVLHPLQIQAVTYIVQRLASLAALFYILAMLCFIQARLTQNQSRSLLWILGCLIAAGLGFLTKQNTATLPLALLLLELLFFPSNRQRLLTISLFSVFMLAGVWLFLAFVFQKDPFSLAAMQALTRETTEISRTAYLATQMKVLWTYIGLFFWPLSAHIDYDYPIINGFLSPYTHYHLMARFLHSAAFLPLIGHLIVITLGLFSVRRWPLLAFGILFYYLAHAVESSLIPIRDVIFEHRTYLPNLGLIIVCCWIILVVLPRWFNKSMISLLVTVLIVTLAVATWQRNQMWRDPIALWQHNVKQAPDKPRGWIILGKHLIQNGQPQAGIDALERSIEKKVNPDGSYSMLLTPETALNLVVAHKMLRQYDHALLWIKRAFQHPLRPFDKAKFLVNQGNIFYEQHRYAEAEAAYRQALAIYPQNLKARNNLASILGMTGRLTQADALYQEVLAIDPNNVQARENLQKLQQLKARQ